MIRKILLVLILLISVLALVGCQTVSGFGKDVSGAADATSEALFSAPDK